MKKIALYPLALLYGVVIWLRNKLFDWGVLTSLPIPGKSICIGNIAVGGTGKSPHVAYLIELLSERFAIQVLSRGYGRKTKGYLEISTHSSAAQVGDEPLMLFENITPRPTSRYVKTEDLAFNNLKNKTQKLFFCSMTLFSTAG